MSNKVIMLLMIDGKILQLIAEMKAFMGILLAMGLSITTTI